MEIWKGFLGAAVAILCFGSYAIPVKLVPTGDGIGKIKIKNKIIFFFFF